MNLDYWEEQIKATLVTAAYLAVPLEESDFTLSATPAMRAIAAGGVATYTISMEPVGGFTASVDLDAASPSPELTLNLVPGAVDPPGQATLTLTDTHTGTMLPSQWYTVPITATGGGITQTVSIGLFIAGVRVYMPIIVQRRLLDRADPAVVPAVQFPFSVIENLKFFLPVSLREY
jgi:hypothetical protein